MDIQAKKLHFIQQILALTNEKVIDKLQALMKKELKGKEKSTKPTAHDLLGVISAEEADHMKKEIEEACENIHEEDWA